MSETYPLDELEIKLYTMCGVWHWAVGRDEDSYEDGFRTLTYGHDKDFLAAAEKAKTAMADFVRAPA